MVKINKVVLIGRMVKDPELKFIQNTGTATTTITLAVDKYNAKTKEREADFINVVVWGKQAENLAEYTVKGSQIAISGRIQTRSYEAKDGTKRYVTEVVADQFGGVQFLGSKGSNSSSNSFGASNEYSAPANDIFGGGNFEEDITPVDDGDMPF